MMSRALKPAQAIPDVPGVPDAHAAPAARPAPATRPGRDPPPAPAAALHGVTKTYRLGRSGHLAAPLATAVYLRMTPGAGLAGVRAAARAGGGRVTATRGLVTAADAQGSRANTRALIVVLGLALVYTVIAIANTLVIATASRRAELAALRLAGATRTQVLRLAGTEAALVAALGTGLAAMVTAVTVAAVRRGLAGVAPASGATVPWTPLAAIGLVCLVVAVLGSVLTAAAGG